VLEIQKWLRPKPNAAAAAGIKTPFAVPEKGHSHYSFLPKTIADQQRAIRMGTLPPHHQALDMRQGHFHPEDFMGYDMKGSRRRSRT
jgi:hypothetical protein